jgi:hypothetical protein
MRLADVCTCKADTERTPAANFDSLKNSNVSYFFSLDATPAFTNAIIAGDRNLEVDGRMIKPGLFILTSNRALTWSKGMHSRFAGVRCGNLLTADGHAENIRTSLFRVVSSQQLATNYLVFP